MSLNDFATRHRRHPGPRCCVCALPQDLLRELEDARGRHSHQTMSDYLREKHKLRVSYWSIGHHFRQGHRTKETV